MNTVWVGLAVAAPVGLILFIGNRLLNSSLTHEGLCPVCMGEGGPCKHCNGLGVIVKSSSRKDLE